MKEKELENEINEKGLNAPRLSPEKIDSKIASFSFCILPSGKSIVCEISLLNGFTVRGDSAVVSIKNFDEEIGKKIAYENARKKIWELEAYLLQEELNQSIKTDSQTEKIQYKWDDSEEWCDYETTGNIMTVDDFDQGVEYGLKYRVVEQEKQK